MKLYTNPIIRTSGSRKTDNPYLFREGEDYYHCISTRGGMCYSTNKEALYID